MKTRASAKCSGCGGHDSGGGGGHMELDILRGETAESHLDALITKRHDQRVKDEGERAEHELWQESVERYNAKRQAELVFAWVEYHERAAAKALANGQAIAARHRAQIETLLGPGRNGHNGNGKEH